MKGAIIGAVLAAAAAAPAFAATATTGCASAVACTMAELLAGGAISVDGLVMSDVVYDVGGLTDYIPNNGTAPADESTLHVFTVRAAPAGFGFLFEGAYATAGFPFGAGFRYTLTAPAGTAIVSNDFSATHVVERGEVAAIEALLGVLGARARRA